MAIPYIVGSSIRDPNNFYNFYDLLANVYEIVGGRQTQSVRLHGLGKSGKTSLLHHLAHPAILKQYVTKPSDYLMIYLDFSTCKNPAEFHQKVYKKLLAKLTDAQTQEPTISSPSLPTVDDITSLLRYFPGKRVVLLMDEFDHLVIGTFNQDFLSELRALASKPDIELAYVTASYRSLEQMEASLDHVPTSPFYSFFHSKCLYLSGFGKMEARDLICLPAAQEGVFFTDDEVENICEMAGTLPYLLQMSAYKWYRMKKDGNSLTSENILKELVVDDANPAFERWWKDLDEEKRLILGEIARKGSVANYGFQNPELEEGLHFLKNYGLVVDEDGIFRINGLVLDAWVRRQIANEKGALAIQSLEKKVNIASQIGSKKKSFIFLSYAKEDKPKAWRLCKRLKEDGFDPWLDKDRILPGQDWNSEIEKALQESRAILLCFSASSIQKAGYIQREYKQAMKYQDEKPEGTIFVIPVRLDECETPSLIQKLQWVDYPRQYDRLVMALKRQMGS